MEQKRKEEELAAKKYEQVAVLNVRRKLQMFRSANTPERYEELKTDMDETIAKEGAALGSQRERLLKEIEEAVSQTKSRMDQILELKKKEEEKKQAEMARRKELKEKALALVAQLEEMVEKCEKSSKGVAEEAEPLIDEKELKLAEINACATAVEEAGKDATENIKQCNDFVLKESVNIKNCPPVQGEAPVTVAQDLAKL